MIYNKFGTSGLSVPMLGFGAGHIGSPSMDEREADHLLNTLIDMGITLFDTARSYGESEARIGKYLSGRRSEFILSTKVGYTYEGADDWSYQATMGTIEESLMRLQTDFIDIVHLHSCDRSVLEKGESIAALEKAREQGKVRVIAYSGENEALQFAIASGRFGSIQCSVNLCDQRSIQQAIPFARKNGMGIIAKRPVANAAWRYTNRPEGHGHAAYFDRLRIMQVNDHGLPMMELALRFAAFAPGVDTCIAGSASLDHVRQNQAYLEKGPLPEELVSHLTEAFATHGADWEGLI